MMTFTRISTEKLRNRRRGVAFSFLCVCTFSLFIALPVFAQVNTGIEFGTATGLSTQDIRVTVAKIIRAIIGLLGIIAVVVVLYGGFLWMTSSGSEEKIAKAKKILVNGAIGLAIVLLSFTIVSFVLSRLSDALSASRVDIADRGGGSLPPIALAGGCADPGGEAPFICAASPTVGPVGSYVTLRGYRFGFYADGSSRVEIGGVAAPIVACGGAPNWSDHLVVVEVPELESLLRYPIELTNVDGRTSGNPVGFLVNDETLGPQVACVIPDEGIEGQRVSLLGKLFGEERGEGNVQFGGDVNAVDVASWSDEAIGTAVPAGALTGNVMVVVGERTSNGYPFRVTCTTGNECSATGCCVESMCVEAGACAPSGPPATVGASCDGDSETPQCEPIACGGGLRCDAATCTCQEGPVISSMSPVHFVHPETGEVYASADAVPEGVAAIHAPNGAPGNYLSLMGRGFGESVCVNDPTVRCRVAADCGEAGGACSGTGTVLFLGGDGVADDRAASLAACARAWSDSQIVIAIPNGATVGPLRVETVDGFSDQTDDARGATFEHFRPNDVLRPGVCSITPSVGERGADVALEGVQFGAARGGDDTVLFGDVASETPEAWGAAAIATTVPNIAEGAVEVRVRVDGELSNAVAFTRGVEPRIPRIQDIVPASGGPGQYVTIRGEYFGDAIGKVFFRRGQEAYEIVPRFPAQCSTNWWHDNEVTIRIPANVSEWVPEGAEPPQAEFDPIGSYEVVVQPRGSELRSNALSFRVTNALPTPGICAVDPVSGPLRTPLELIGERFGVETGVIRFFNGVNVTDADRNGFAWADGLIRGILVPPTAETGPVQLWRLGDNPDAPAAEQRGSNPVTFEVRDCRTDGCGDGQQCCGDGRCVAAGDRCSEGPFVGSYQWTFATGIIPKVPRVVESCAAFSPSPWDMQGSGMDACVNANVRVQLSASMDLGDLVVGGAVVRRAADRAADAVQVFRCGGGANVAPGGGGFEREGALDEWRVIENGANELENAWVHATRVTLPEGEAHGEGAHALRLEKRLGASVVDRAQDPPVAGSAPRTTDLPRDASVDRHYFAVGAPGDLISDTNGVTYTVRVFVRGENPSANPNMRAGIVVGRQGGPQPADPGWWQQASREVTIDGTWQELSATVTFDRGENRGAPGFIRLYATAPSLGEVVSEDDTFEVFFDDLSIVRAGDPCATRTDVSGLMVEVSDSGGRQQLSNNVVSFIPAEGVWIPGTWYEVIVYGDDTVVRDGEGERRFVAMHGAAEPGLRLDGDKDGEEGGNYRFRFRTRESAEPCALQSVVVTPASAVATQPAPAFADFQLGASAEDPGLVHARADGLVDPANCYTINASSIPWDWDIAQPVVDPPKIFVALDDGGGGWDGRGRWCIASGDCASVTCRTDADCAGVGGSCNEAAGRCVTTFCSENRCDVPRPGGLNRFAYTATAQARLETPISLIGTPQPATLAATATLATPRTGTSGVEVRYEKPRVVAVYPTSGCQEACPNATVAAVTNVDIDPASIVGNASISLCAQESCRRDGMTPLVDVRVLACPGNAEDAACRSRMIGSDPQILFSGVTFNPNASYRVVLNGAIESAWGVPLEELNYANNDRGAIDAYSWVFRTRSELCGVSNIQLQPDPLVFNAVGERRSIAARPFAAPDSCSPAGQPLNAESLAWEWDVLNAAGLVAEFTQVTDAGAFASPSPAQLARTNVLNSPACTLQCLRPGSRRVPGICGNELLEEPAEECERTMDTDGDGRADAFPSWCNPNTCLRTGARPEADGGSCGNGALDPGEECDATRRCSAGPRQGERCELNADCIVDVDGIMVGGPCEFEFPAWCAPQSCLRAGSGAGSVCGNGSLGDGEDCDDGNTTSGDGCSSRCLAEGTPQLYDAVAAPHGIRARCGDGIVTVEGGEECDLGVAEAAAWSAAGCNVQSCTMLGAAPVGSPGGTCGNGDPTDPGEQCDDGVAGVCTLDAENAGAACATDSDCIGAGARCSNRRPVGGDGCSSRCLFEGASFAWRNHATGIPQPSICGDGFVHTGEACDVGSISGEPDPAQLLAAMGEAPADANGVQQTTATAAVRGIIGRGSVRLICGHDTDAACNFPPPITPTSHGIDRSGCCQLRPSVTNQSPDVGEAGVCRNAQITARFDVTMDPTTVGARVDPASGVVSVFGAVLERRRDALWEATAATPTMTQVQLGERTVSELTFMLDAALEPSTLYRVRLRGVGDGNEPIRSEGGVAFGGLMEEWVFTTGAQICVLDTLNVLPSSYLLQRRGARAPLRAIALATNGRAITPVPGYSWDYTWGSAATDIAVTDAGWEDPASGQAYACEATNRCAFQLATPSKNGDTVASAVAEVSENILSRTCAADGDCGAGETCAESGAAGRHCIGQTAEGASQLRAFICENPWPPVQHPSTWSPYPRVPMDLDDDGVDDVAGDPGSALVDEHVSIAYCRDAGDRRVCKESADAIETGLEPECTQESDCAGGRHCLPSRLDDLPAFSYPVVERTPGVNGLREEYFFLPRDIQPGDSASYCSVSGARCDPSLAASCPPGEFCREGQDAVGLRIYTNADHLPAARWYREQGFTEQVTPLVVDGYRGVQGGRSTYINIANTGSIFTNLIVLSFNQDAVAETRAILQQVLDGLRINTDLVSDNERLCRAGTVVREVRQQCAGSGNACASDLDCAAGRCEGSAGQCRVNADCAPVRGMCMVTRLFGRVVSGTCKVTGERCTVDADCPPRFVQCVGVERCESMSRDVVVGVRGGRCSTSGSGCYTDGDCGAGETCDGTRSFGCSADNECRVGSTTGMCAAPKDKLTRDVQRLEDLIELRSALQTFGAGQRRCSITPQSCAVDGDCPLANERCIMPSPELAAGTFVPGMTTSKWPSWQAELGAALGITIPLDPLNVFAGPCADGADPATCWNQETQTYQAPVGSHLYQYRRAPDGGWRLGTAFEYIDDVSEIEPDHAAWGGASLPPEITAGRDIISSAYGVEGRCGDGLLQAGEQCDPPGRTGVPAGQSASCALPGGVAGFRTWTCEASCTWSAPSACAASCGNFQIDYALGERCDVGPSGGRVPPGQAGVGVVPGITVLDVPTQYACGAAGSPQACQWTGGFCGDGELQSAYGEQCDSARNVAATARVSSASSQYACTSRTERRCGGIGATCTNDAGCASDPAGTTCTDAIPCRSTGGFCGDGVVQDGGSTVRACRAASGAWGREPCTSNADCGVGETCVVRVAHAPSPPSLPDPAEQCDGNEARSCVVGSGTLSSIGNPYGNSNMTIDYPFTMQSQASGGSIRLTIVARNRGQDLSGLTRDVIESVLVAGGSGRTINDFNPRGVQGGAGLYHRFIVRLCNTGGGACVDKGILWSLASDTAQRNTVVISGVPSGAQRLQLYWDNDWCCGPQGQDSNIQVEEVILEGQQERRCGAPGTASACSTSGVGLGWQACIATSALCGNGTVDPGEECDDGGRGRCSNNPTRSCQRDDECGSGNRCDQGADQCTPECKRNVCGDAFQLAPTCTAGDPGRIGQPCTSDSVCGRGGVCNTEACDLGVSNWRVTCSGPADQQCVPNAECGYGRTCNYCVSNTCTVATKQGGVCGDAILNGPEVCDFWLGTNQCTGNTNICRRNFQTLADLNWRKEVCNETCNATCPPTYSRHDVHFTQHVGPPSWATLSTNLSTGVVVPACRLLGSFLTDVEFSEGVGRMNVVIVTDRSGSMGSGAGSSMQRAINAIANDGGLIDQLFAGRGASRVRIGLVSYSTDVTVDHALSDNTGRSSLKSTVRGYRASGSTYTDNALQTAMTMLQNDATPGADVIVLMSDGAPTRGHDPSAVASTFKGRTNSFLYTVAFTSDGGLQNAMRSWSSDPHALFAFGGSNIEQLYEAIANALSTVTITVTPAIDPGRGSAVTQIRNEGPDRTISAQGIEEFCRGPGNTGFTMLVNFMGSSDATITLRNPRVGMCIGPPWPR